MLTANVSKWAAGIVLATLTAAQGVVLAAGLQISPISITIPADKRADEVWLRNTSAEVVHAQVRVYHWSQAEGEDVLAPDQHMVASPPMVQLQPGQQQLVRLVRVGPLTAPASSERTYRLLIDELPIQRSTAKAGLDFVFRYSVPVFIAGTAPAKAQLDWSVQEVDGQAWLRVANSGTSRAQLANIEYTPQGGKAVMAMNGLAGYVLAGQYRSLQLGLPTTLFAKGGVFSSLTNAVHTETRVAPIIKTP
ncbi:molecular chaperone [Alcaligenaceae bacterium]|nr:molecular chaperone [Alcaligenaceae bacterium]